jgi:hypothetical protein
VGLLLSSSSSPFSHLGWNPPSQRDETPPPHLEINGSHLLPNSNLDSNRVSHIHDFPSAKKLLFPTNRFEQYDSRTSQVLHARNRFVDSCVVYRDHDETKAFLELLDALEIEKEQILLDHKTYVSSLEKELRKAKTRVVDPDPWKFVGDGEILDSLSASSQSGMQNNTSSTSLVQPQSGNIPAQTSNKVIQTLDHVPSDPASVGNANILDQSSSEVLENPPFINQPNSDHAGSAPRLSGKRLKEQQKDLSKFKFKCDKCGKSFTRSPILQEHKRSHNDERRWACQLCPKRFVRVKDRNRHQSIQHAEKKIECGMSIRWHGKILEWGCHQRFSREDGLISHLRTEKGWKCIQTFPTRAYLADLVDEVVDGDNLRCSLTSNCCQQEFAWHHSLRQHLNQPAGKKCAKEWIIHHLVKMSRGKSDTSPVLVHSNAGEEQSPPPGQMNGRVPDKVRDDDKAEGDPKTPIPMESSRSSIVANMTDTPDSVVPSHFLNNNFLPSPSSFHPEWNFTSSASNSLPIGIAERTEKRPLHVTAKDSDISLQRLSGNVVQSAIQLRSEASPDNPPSPAGVPSDTESPQISGIEKWGILDGSHTEIFFRGGPFWVMIQCLVPLEGKRLLFSFGEHYSDATVTREYDLELVHDPQQYLYKISAWSSWFISPWADRVEIRIYPYFHYRNHSLPPPSFLAVGTLLLKHYTSSKATSTLQGNRKADHMELN